MRGSGVAGSRPQFVIPAPRFREEYPQFVIPAHAGIHLDVNNVKMGPRFRGDDEPVSNSLK